MPGANGGFQRIHHCVHRIVAAAFQSAKNRHQNRLRLRARFALVTLNHLAHNHRRAYFPFAVIVGGRNLRMAQKDQQFVPVFFQARGDSFDVPVCGLNQHQINQSFVQPVDARLKHRGIVFLPMIQSKCIAKQPLRLLGKFLPIRRHVDSIHLLEFTQQMRQAILMRRVDVRVTRPKRSGGTPKSLTRTPSKVSRKNSNSAGSPRLG